MNSFPSFHINKNEYENNPLLKQKTFFSNKVSYKLVQYDKVKMEELYPIDPDVLISSKYRSVFLNPDTDEVICFSPPKSTPVSTFMYKYPHFEEISSIITETIEGTMITLFYDRRLNNWEICTKSAIGGKYFYYRTEYNNDTNRQLTFRSMFCEAFGINELSEIRSNDRCYLVKNHCYTFILQHPDNHMVLPVKKPKVYLVAVHEFNQTRTAVSPVMQYEFEKWDIFLNEGTKIHYPKIYLARNYDEINDAFCKMTERYDNMGFMVTNIKTGDRTTFRNPGYDYIRELRGNNPNLQYQYLDIVKKNRVKEFLSCFPIYKKQFRGFHDSYHECITQIHNSYVSYYVLKTGKRIAKKYMPIIYRLHHEIYLPSKLDVERGKIIIQRNVVKNFIKTYETGYLFHLIKNLNEPYITDPEPEEGKEPDEPEELSDLDRQPDDETKEYVLDMSCDAV